MKTLSYTRRIERFGCAALLVGAGLFMPIPFAFAQNPDIIEPQVETGSEEGVPVNFSTLDENCTASVLNRTVRLSELGGFDIFNVPADGRLVRVCVVCETEGEVFAGKTDFFRVTAGEEVDIPPVRLGPVSPSLQFTTLALSSRKQLNGPGAQSQMSVTGTFSDGTESDISSAASGTTYTSSNTAIVSVGEDGLVTANGPGTAFVSVVNSGIFGAIRIAVMGGDDTDMDGLPDAYEEDYGLDPNNTADAASDTDGDNLTALQEFEQGTDPTIADTDGDGFDDGDEAAIMANPLFADSDFDGVADGDEPNPTADSDSDGKPNVLDSDSDNDGLSDGVEYRITMGASTTSASPSADDDGDGLTNGDEVADDVQTDPADPDTDHDGLTDGEEITDTMTDPLIPDMEDPVVTLVKPVPGTDLVQGETLNITAAITDDGRVQQVEVLVDGVDIAPLPITEKGLDDGVYSYPYTVGLTATSLTLEINATDTNMNTGATGVLTFVVGPDPLTTVTGIVVDEEQTPVQGAMVEIYSTFSGVTGPDGSFSIANVSTVMGPVIAMATAEIGGESLRARSSRVDPVRGGVTDVGTMQLGGGLDGSVVVTLSANLSLENRSLLSYSDHSALLAAIEAAGATVVEITEITGSSLSEADVFFYMPSLSPTEAEQEAVLSFLAGGGGVLAFTENPGCTCNVALDSVIGLFGLTRLQVSLGSSLDILVPDHPIMYGEFGVVGDGETATLSINNSGGIDQLPTGGVFLAIPTGGSNGAVALVEGGAGLPDGYGPAVVLYDVNMLENANFGNEGVANRVLTLNILNYLAGAR